MMFWSHHKSLNHFRGISTCEMKVTLSSTTRRGKHFAYFHCAIVSRKSMWFKRRNTKHTLCVRNQANICSVSLSSYVLQHIITIDIIIVIIESTCNKFLMKIFSNLSFTLMMMVLVMLEFTYGSFTHLSPFTARIHMWDCVCAVYTHTLWLVLSRRHELISTKANVLDYVSFTLYLYLRLDDLMEVICIHSGTPNIGITWSR